MWQLLLEDPSHLTCDECFALMEYYAEVLTRCGTGILAKVLDHLEKCPSCGPQHREALHRLAAIQSDGSTSPLPVLVGSNGSSAKG